MFDLSKWLQPSPLNQWYDQMGNIGVSMSDATDLNSFIQGNQLAGSQGLNLGSQATGGQTMFGMNLDKFNAGLGGLQTLGNLWNSFQGNKLAKDQFNTAKGFANKNLANQIKSYNTALTDRITSRASSNGLTQEQVDQYIKENRM